jgi:hypothetical protein
MNETEQLAVLSNRQRRAAGFRNLLGDGIDLARNFRAYVFPSRPSFDR